MFFGVAFRSANFSYGKSSSGITFAFAISIIRLYTLALAGILEGSFLSESMFAPSMLVDNLLMFFNWQLSDIVFCFSLIILPSQNSRWDFVAFLFPILSLATGFPQLGQFKMPRLIWLSRRDIPVNRTQVFVDGIFWLADANIM